MDLKNREDRIGKYLTPFLNDYILMNSQTIICKSPGLPTYFQACQYQ